MHKFLFIYLLLFGISSYTPAQSVINGNDNLTLYEYYIRITGISTKQDVVNLQNRISKKSGVVFFMANRFPVRYFSLRSNRNITVAEFKSWLTNQSCTIEFFGMGSKAKEQATVLYNNTKTSH